MAKPDRIPIPYLCECLAYDPPTGVLIWRERPLTHFADERAHKSWLARFAGKHAGAISDGYIIIAIMYNSIHFRPKAHRIAWALTTGTWPATEIDHRNGNPSDNRFDNLRPATKAEQQQNISARKTNQSGGLLGASFFKRTGRWSSQICISGRKTHLGFFSTKEEAHAAYLKAKKELHQFQSVPR